MPIDRLFLVHKLHEFRADDGWFGGEAILHNCGHPVARLPFRTDFRGVVLGPGLIYTSIMRVAPALRRNGFGSRLMGLALPEIINLVDSYNFDNRRFYAATEHNNEAAIEILKNNGFSLIKNNGRSVRYQKEF
ncbi:MAG TPA: GNAT family N-acetyltransferase [Candidatus Nanoarchaeia archaeon]|nr:GNAT family N-acetyltransferase [Candidatus Nanoarchaeia archaeon]